MKKKILFVLIIIGALLFAGSVLGLGGYFYKINPGANEVPHDTFTRGLVGYWDFDEGAGTTAQDYSGNNNHGTLENGPTWTADSPEEGGSSLEFDGVDDYVDMNDMNLHSYSNVTVEMWLKPATSNTDNSLFVSANAGNIVNSPYIHFIAGGAIRAQFANSAGMADIIVTSTTTDFGINWHHLVWTWGSAGVHLYIDAIEEDDNVYTGHSYSQDEVTRIGGGYGSISLDGQIDEVRIYNRALSAEEIRYHYNRGGPVAEWNFDEGSGSIAYDSTGNGNDGTWNGTGTHWATGRFGTAGQFSDASGDYVSISNNISNAKTISFWTNLDTTTEDIISGDGTGIIVDSGTMSYGAWDNCFVNGVDTDIITTGWRHVVLTSTSDVSLTAIKLGYTAGGLDGKLDDVKIYQYERSSPEILLDYNKGKAAHFGLSTADCEADPASCMDYGLVGNWGMDEGAGQTTTDLSGNQNYGTLENGPIWTADSPEEGGSSLNFDGTDDYVDCGNNASLQIQNYMTIMAWVKTNTAADQTIVDKYGTNGGAPLFYIKSSGNFQFFAYDGANLINKESSTFNIIDGNWHHVAVTVDNPNGKLIWYVDGVSESDTFTTTGNWLTAQNFYIGYRNKGGVEAYFNGQLDQVRIYNRVLSAEEVRYHYNRGGPVAEWNFDEGSGSIAYDSTDNGNDGTWNGAGTHWVTGKYGTAGQFTDASGDYVSIANNISNAKTISFWTNLDTTTEDIISGDGTGITVDSGTMSYGAWDNCFVDGVDTDIITTGWHHVVLTSTSDVSLTSIKLGYTDGGLDGKLDDVKIYNYERSAPEILLDYNKGKATHFGLSTTDCEADPASCMDYGLVGNWGMDEGAGTTAQDYSGNNNHGTLENGPSWTKGQSSGGGLSFDGTDDYVDCGANDKLEMNTTFTLCIVLKTTSVSREDPLGRWTVADSYAGYGFSMYNTWAGMGVGQIGLFTGDVVARYVVSTKTINDGKYHFVVGTYDGVTGKIYIDGVLDNSKVLANNLASPGRTFYIGRSNDDHFNGTIDEVRIYNRALSAEEVRYHYNRGGPVAEWKMNERTGAKIYDSTSNNNDGKLDFGAAGTNTSYEDMWQGASDNLGIEFDGTDDYVDIGALYDGVKTVEFWAKPTAVNITEEAIDLNGTAYVKITNGIVSGEGFTSPTIYLNGITGTTITTSWNYIVLTTATGINASDFDIGKLNSSYFDGEIDFVRIYNRALEASEVLEKVLGREDEILESILNFEF